MGKPLKIERIEDMSRLLWLEHVITEASLMTRSIRLHSILMNWMCFPLQVWGGFAHLCPHPTQLTIGESGGQRPPAKIEAAFDLEIPRKRSHYNDTLSNTYLTILKERKNWEKNKRKETT